MVGIGKEGFSLNDLFGEWYDSLTNISEDTKKMLGRYADLGSSVFSAASKISQGLDKSFQLKMQAVVNENNAALMANNDLLIQQTFQDKINDIQRKGVVFKGQQMEQMSQSGFEVSSSSYQNLLDNTDFEIAKNVAALKLQETTQLSQSKYNQQMSLLQAQLARKSAKRARTSGIIQGITTLGSGIGGFVGD